MSTVTTTRSEAKYLASHALLAAGYDHAAVGRAMLALEPADQAEPETFEPSPEDEADYRAWCAEVDARNRDIEDAHREAQWLDPLERREYEEGCQAWQIRPA